MTPIIIYKSDTSPSSSAVIMLAEILDLKYETRNINILAGENRTPEYLEKNPLHTVPVLEDGDYILADSHAILTYLVSKYGAEKRAELYPNDLGLRATIIQRMFFEASVLFPVGTGAFKSIVLDKAAGPSEKQIADTNDAYEVLDKYLQKTKFVASNYLTIADLAIVATLSIMSILLPVDEKFEKVISWLDRLQNEEWCQKVIAPGLTAAKDLLQNSSGTEFYCRIDEFILRCFVIVYMLWC